MNFLASAPRALAVLILIIGSLTSWHDAALAVPLSPGDIILAANIQEGGKEGPALLRVDPVTGDRTVITGPDLTYPFNFDFQFGGVVRHSNGSLAITVYEGNEQVQSVDPATGARTIVSRGGRYDIDDPIGAGPLWSAPSDLKVGADGRIYVAADRAVFAVDPLTGNRTLVSGQAYKSAPVGSGPAFDALLIGMLLEDSGSLLVSQYDYTNPAIVRVDPTTGAREIVSGPGVGSGPLFGPLAYMAYDQNGNVLATTWVSGETAAGIYRINPTTGDRELISGGDKGAGPAFSDGLSSIGVLPNGTIVAGDFISSALFAVDPLSGDRSILSDNAHGLGPVFGVPRGIFVVVPEPGTFLLAATGLVAMAGYAWRKRQRG